MTRGRALAGWIRRRGPLSINIALAGVAVGLFAIVDAANPIIEENDGLGWVGVDYAAMLRGGWAEGDVNPALRPLIVWLDTPAYRAFGGDVIAAFTAMNYVYVGLLAFAACQLFDRYTRDTPAKVLMIVNIFLCVATATFVTFYPVNVDIGAYAILVLTILAIVSGKSVLAAIACAAVVLSRELGLAAVLFGIHRDLRQHVPLLRTVATYAPALLVVVGWRALVASRNVRADDGVVTIGRLVNNLNYWKDPVFVTFFAYFLLTVLGGVSLFALLRCRDVGRLLRQEHEWLTLAAFVVGIAAVGDLDLWRYLAFLLPLYVAAFAVATRAFQLPRERWALGLVVCLATVLTQRPFQHIDLVRYFRDWFPYYVYRGDVPFGPVPPLWDAWRWKLLGACLLGIAAALGPRLANLGRARDAARPPDVCAP